MQYLPRFLLAITFLALTTKVHAADVRITSRVPGEGCHLTIKGPIEIGDAKKVSAALRELDREFTRRLDDQPLAGLWSLRYPSLCLDSPGGSYPEGLRIAQLLITPSTDLRTITTGVTTSIAAGSQCMSACALIFMTGQFMERGGERVAARTLHVQGKLGFHAPYVAATRIPDKEYSREELADAHTAAVKSVQGAIKLFSFNIKEQSGSMGARPWVRPSLFAEMLARASNEIFLIDTVGKAGRWDVDLGGVRGSISLDSNRLRTACANFLAWQEDAETLGDKALVERIPRGHPEFPKRVQWPLLMSDANVSIFKFTYTKADTLCAVAPHIEPDPQRPWMNKPNGRVIGLRMSIFNGAQRYDHPYDLATWAAEDPGLPITKLPRER